MIRLLLLTCFLAAFPSQGGCARSENTTKVNATKLLAHIYKSKPAKDVPPLPFDIPPPEEIHRMIKEDGFFATVFNKMLELFLGMLTAPFRWVYRVGEFFIVVLKLANETIHQFNQRRTKVVN